MTIRVMDAQQVCDFARKEMGSDTPLFVLIGDRLHAIINFVVVPDNEMILVVTEQKSRKYG